jgi:hypothetical protein
MRHKLFNFRATPQDLQALRRLQAAYGLRTLSAAARHAIRAAAADRGLLDDREPADAAGQEVQRAA